MVLHTAVSPQTDPRDLLRHLQTRESDCRSRATDAVRFRSTPLSSVRTSNVCRQGSSRLDTQSGRLCRAPSTPSDGRLTRFEGDRRPAATFHNLHHRLRSAERRYNRVSGSHRRFILRRIPASVNWERPILG